MISGDRLRGGGSRCCSCSVVMMLDVNPCAVPRRASEIRRLDRHDGRADAAGGAGYWRPASVRPRLDVAAATRLLAFQAFADRSGRDQHGAAGAAATYTDYILPFQAVVGLVLLVAMLGAIVLTLAGQERICGGR